MIKSKRRMILEFLLGQLIDTAKHSDRIGLSSMYAWVARAYLSGCITSSERKVLDEMCWVIEEQSGRRC